MRPRTTIFLIISVFFIVSCKSGKGKRQVLGENSSTIAYVNIHLSEYDYPLHASLLFEDTLPFKSLDQCENIEELMCSLYGSGNRILDGSSINYTKFGQSIRDSLLAMGLSSKIDKLYDRLHSITLNFEHNNYVSIGYASIELRYVKMSESLFTPYDWLDYEYEVGDSCVRSNETLYLIDILN